MDIIAQLATTSLSPSESQKQQGLQNPDQRNYNFVAQQQANVNQQKPQEEEQYESGEEEGDEAHLTSANRKVNYACTECRKAHKACSGGRPCERCSKLGLDSKCRSSARKKRILTKKYWFDFLQQQQQQQTGGANGPKQPIFVDHFAVENMKQQLENKVIQRQKQALPRTTETFQFQTYIPPVPMQQYVQQQQQQLQRSNSSGSGGIISPRGELYSSPRQGMEQLTPQQSPRVLSPRQELYSPRMSNLEQQMSRGLSLESPRGSFNQLPVQMQQPYDSPRQQFSPRIQQQQSQQPMQQFVQQQQLQRSNSGGMMPNMIQQQFQQQQSPRYNVLPNSFDQQQGFDNVHANVYQSPRLGTGISPRVLSETNQSPRMGIMSPRLVDSNLGSPRPSIPQVYSPRPMEHVSNISSPRAPYGVNSPRTFSPPNSLENYKIGRPSAMETLPSIPQLESISELTKNMTNTSSPRFKNLMETGNSPTQQQQPFQQQQYQNFNQQWR